MRIVAVVGSLRQKSFNRALALEAAKRFPAGTTVDVVTLETIPLFNQDVLDAGVPEPVTTLAKQVAAADAVLVVSPEYNYSIPGVLKNALDWLSRLVERPLNGKPMALASASIGIFGGVRMQLHLRQALMFTGGNVMTRPEFFLGTAGAKFDANLTLTDDETKKHLQAFVDAFVKFAASR